MDGAHVREHILAAQLVQERPKELPGALAVRGRGEVPAKLGTLERQPGNDSVLRRVVRGRGIDELASLADEPEPPVLLDGGQTAALRHGDAERLRQAARDLHRLDIWQLLRDA